MSIGTADYAKKETRVIDLHITVDPPTVYTYFWKEPVGSPEYFKRLQREYESWAKDFMEFIRDHRSQDPVQLNVERVTEDICSNCHSEWEPYLNEESGCLECVNCGKEIVQ